MPLTAAERRAAEVRKRTGGRRKGAEERATPVAPDMPAPWVDEGPAGKSDSASNNATLRRAPKGSARSSRSTRSRNVRALDEVVAEFTSVLGAKVAPKELRRYEEALGAFEDERYPEARRLLEPLLRRATDLAAVQDLAGLCLYRERKWGKAAECLEKVRSRRPGFVHNHAVLADCYRALGRHDEVEMLWREVGESSANAELVAESRIVLAGSLADRGRLSDALALFREQNKQPRQVKEHHLRQWYVAADLTDKLGDVVGARALFTKIVSVDPEFADVAERLAVLGA